MADLIGIGLSGLRAHQTALSVTGNNVSNTNTPGYSRQEAVFVDNPSLLSGTGYIGQGVNTATIRRISEDFIVDQVRSDTTVYNERNAVLEQATSIDNLLASTTTGLTPALSSFFQAFQGGADDPTSIPQRQLLLTQSEGLAARFHSLDSRLNSQMQNINLELVSAVSSINSLAQSLAELNSSISVAIGAGQGDIPNQLFDARDETLRQLSELVSVSTFSQGAGGQQNVFIGNGQPLVLGGTAATLATVENPSDSSRQEVALIINGVSNIVSDELSGGRVGGLFEFRDNELTEAINGLGRIAIVLSDSVNEQHALGMDLESNLGGLFFRDINETSLAQSRVISNSQNLGPYDQSIQINITDSQALTIDDYEMVFEGPTANDFNIIRSRDSEIVLSSTLPGIFPASVEIDGFEVRFEAGTFKVGDRFTISPTKTGASDIGIIVNRVEAISLASPIRADASLGNTGNAEISLGSMLDVINPLTNQGLAAFSVAGQMSPPLEIEFLTATTYQVLNVTDPSNPVPLSPPLNNQRYNQGVTNTLFTGDPGEVRVISAGGSALTVPPVVASPGPFNNGIAGQTLSILSRDTSTGVVTPQSIVIASNSSASTVASSLQNVQGIQATAYTHVRLDNFTDDGAGALLGVTINGQAYPPAPIPPATLPIVITSDSLADLINADTSLQALNIYAVSNGTELDIRSTSGENIEVEVTGAGDSVRVSTVDPYNNAGALNPVTVTSGNGLAVAGVVDVTMAEGLSFTSNAAGLFELAPVGQSTYLGFQFEMKGQAEAGDSFTINYNEGGVSDNRNALALADLEGEGSVSNGVISYGEAYSQIIEEIGTVTNRARLDTESAKALLIQSENNLQSISGVNLDEEAGRLIQYQAAYNASAQVVSIARELFDTLLATFR